MLVEAKCAIDKKQMGAKMPEYPGPVFDRNP